MTERGRLAPSRLMCRDSVGSLKYVSYFWYMRAAMCTLNVMGSFFSPSSQSVMKLVVHFKIDCDLESRKYGITLHLKIKVITN